MKTEKGGKQKHFVSFDRVALRLSLDEWILAASRAAGGTFPAAGRLASFPKKRALGPDKESLIRKQLSPSSPLLASSRDRNLVQRSRNIGPECVLLSGQSEFGAWRRPVSPPSLSTSSKLLSLQVLLRGNAPNPFLSAPPCRCIGCIASFGAETQNHRGGSVKTKTTRKLAATLTLPRVPPDASLQEPLRERAPLLLLLLLCVGTYFQEDLPGHKDFVCKLVHCWGAGWRGWQSTYLQ